MMTTAVDLNDFQGIFYSILFYSNLCTVWYEKN